MKNAIAKMKNTLEGIKNGLDRAENWISNLEDKVAENTPSEHQKEKGILKMRIVRGTFGRMWSAKTAAS